MSSDKPLILMVDDNPKNLEVLCHTLQSEGYNLAIAVDGYRALEYLEKKQPDLILLDVMMPGLDGFSVCKRIKTDERWSQIPIIFLTAKSDSQSVETAFGLGGVDYVTKPFFTGELLARVRTHVHLRQQQKKLEAAFFDQQRLFQETMTQTKNLLSQVENLDRMKDDFIETVSHILRTPLTSILGYAEALADMVSDVKNGAKLSQAILESSNQLERFIERILLLTMLQYSGLAEYRFKPIHLSEITDFALAELEALNLEVGGLNLEAVTGDIQLSGDPTKLGKALSFVLENALNYSEGKSVVVTNQLQDEKLHILIQDFGPGIQREERQKVFDRFYQCRRPGGNINGAGLGLPLARLIIEAHQGSIQIEDSDTGTLVAISLPIAEL